MARPKQAIPSYFLHRATGQARVYVDGRITALASMGAMNPGDGTAN